jgi:hypothetical protein
MKADVKSSDARESEALKWATDVFQAFADLMSAGASSKQKEIGMLVSFCDELKCKNEEEYEQFVCSMVKTALFEGSQYFIAALRELAAAKLERNEPLTGFLQFFIRMYLRYPNMTLRRTEDPSVVRFEMPKRAAGRKRDDHLARNHVINMVIESLTNKWGFLATRNAAAKHPSAASIVKAALESAGVYLEERSINKIWEDRTALDNPYERHLLHWPEI